MAMSKYTRFGCRYLSFDDVNDTNSHFLMLALDGLYLEQKGERSTVRCAFCSFELDSLYSTEICRSYHMISNPYCIHFCTSHGLKKISQDLVAANDLAWQYEEVRCNLVRHFIQPMLGVSYFNQPISFCSSSNVEFSWPTNMEMADFSERRNSLNSISSQTRHSLADIADAGFYYDTNRVALICYYCGEHVDIHYLNQRPDPWRAHLSASSKCFHNILMRGDDFILSDKLDSEADGHIIGKGIKRRRNHEQGASCQTNAPKKMKTASGEVLDCYLYPVPRESFDDSYTCFRCKVSARNPDLVLTLCCQVCVCFVCARIDQCPKCYRSHFEVPGLNNQMDCD